MSLTIRPVCPVWGRNPKPFFVLNRVISRNGLKILFHRVLLMSYERHILYEPFNIGHIIWAVKNPAHGSFIDIWYYSLVHDELMEWTNKRSSRVTNKMHSDLISFQHSIPWFSDCHQFVTNFDNDNRVFDALSDLLKIKEQWHQLNTKFRNFKSFVNYHRIEIILLKVQLR